MRLVLAALALLALTMPAHAHDPADHPEMSPEWLQWFRTLTDQNGRGCCDGNDGVEPDGWRLGDKGHQVMIDGKWIDVPGHAMVKQRNLFNRARVWITHDNDGLLMIRCFMPGASG